MNVRQLPQTRVAEIIANLQLFAGLSAECIRRLSAGARQISIAKGELLFRFGEPARAMYVLVSGQVKKYLPLSNGAEKVIALFGPNDALGVAPAYLGEMHANYAVSKTDSHLLAVNRDTVVRLARHDAEFAGRVLASVSRRVLHLTRDIESCTPRTTVQRLSCFLLQFRPDARAKTYYVALPASKREIAAKLNFTPESLSRALNVLSGEGAISVNKHVIRVLDAGKLVAISPEGCPNVAA